MVKPKDESCKNNAWTVEWALDLEGTETEYQRI